MKLHKKRFQVSPLRHSGYAGQAAQPPAQTTAGLINKRNFKKRISNDEYRIPACHADCLGLVYTFIHESNRRPVKDPFQGSAGRSNVEGKYSIFL